MKMIHSSVTISLVPEARGGPFIFWNDLEGGCAKAAALGFEAVEIFAPAAEFLSAGRLKTVLTERGLKLAALGTGAGWILRKLRLTDPDPDVRRRAREFISTLIDLAGSFGAPAIIGSMQGRFEGDTSREQALAWLAESLNALGQHAGRHGVPLLFEPLNRYETNLVNRVADGLKLLDTLETKNVKLLCDLFHMNIEEASIADALRSGGERIGHIHFVDSNRGPAGSGHIDFAPIAQVLREIRYSGYASAEALPHPDSDEAARLTLIAFKKYFSFA